MNLQIQISAVFDHLIPSNKRSNSSAKILQRIIFRKFFFHTSAATLENIITNIIATCQNINFLKESISNKQNKPSPPFSINFFILISPPPRL